MAFDTDKKVTISITTESILRVILILIGVAFLWIIRDVIVLVFVSLILASAFFPTVLYLKRYGIPKILGLAMIYVAFLGILTWIVIGISGPIATEIRNLSSDLPDYYQALNDGLLKFRDSSSTLFTPDRYATLRGGLDQSILNLSRLASTNALSAITAMFGSLFSAILILVMTFYFVVYEGAVRQFIVWILPRAEEEKVYSIIEKIQNRLGMWLRGQVLLSIIIFLMVYVGLSLLGVKYALVLALLAGFFEVIPFLGPIFGAAPGVLLTLISPWGGLIKALLVLGMYIIVQQLENHLVVPKVMAKTVGLNPLVVIITILIGAKVAGIVGALIAIPLVTAATVYFEETGHIKELIS